MMPARGFKICPNCRFAWRDRDHFLRDESLTIIGYQANFKDLRAGILMFNHSCRGTLALPVTCFEDLYIGPVIQQRLTGTEACPGYCFRKSRLNPCPNECECAFVRHIITLLKNKQTHKQADEKDARLHGPDNRGVVY